MVLESRGRSLNEAGFVTSIQTLQVEDPPSFVSANYGRAPRLIYIIKVWRGNMEQDFIIGFLGGAAFALLFGLIATPILLIKRRKKKSK